MKQALLLAKEIQRKKHAIEKTSSQHLRNDYAKSIRQDQRELKAYCQFKGLDYREVMRSANE